MATKPKSKQATQNRGGQEKKMSDNTKQNGERPTEVVVGDSITVRDLATLINRSPIDLIKILMQFGIMAPITHSIDHDTAVILGEELGVAVKWPEPEVGEEGEEEDDSAHHPQMLKRTFVQDLI
jgi:translation initiation factor IF-2